MALGWLTIPGCLGLKPLLGHETFSAEPRRVLSKPGRLSPCVTVLSGRNLGLLYAGSRRYLLHTLSLSVSLPLRGVKKKNKEGLFVRNFPLIWPSGRASVSSTSYLQAWDEGNRGCKGTQHIQCSFFLVCVLNAHKYLFWGDWLPLGWEFRYFWILII